MGDEELEAALTGADVVVIPAGVPRKPGMTRDDLFKINAGIVATLMTGVAKHCPNVRLPHLLSLMPREITSPQLTHLGGMLQLCIKFDFCFDGVLHKPMEIEYPLIYVTLSWIPSLYNRQWWQ